jgi:hypothetical protein
MKRGVVLAAELLAFAAGCGGGAGATRTGAGTGGAVGSGGAIGSGGAVGVGGGAGGDGAAGAGAGESDGGLDAGVSPGGNFDLSLWELQEPVGAAGSPTTIAPSALAGPSGFHDSYFFTDPADGAMTFWDPENGVTTADSSYPRSELREMNADGSPANWPVSGTNVLSATVAVTAVPDHVCIGQIHLGTAIQAGLAASTKPLLELYYYATGDIALGIEDDPTGGQTAHQITNVPLGAKFSYSIQLTGDGTITLGIGDETMTFAMPPSFAGYGQYFKAGDYDQTAGTDGTVGATVKFYALQLSH